MAELQSPQHPLEVLPAMLNLMLVQTGKFFKEAASDEPGDLVSAKHLLTEVGTSANRRFHEALDEIEIEFTRAKAVFERDLRKERAKRAERERAAGILTRPAGVVKARSPSAGTKKSPPGTCVDKPAKDAGVHDAAGNKDDEAEDHVMVNGLDTLEDPKIKSEASEANRPEAPAQNDVNVSSTKASPGTGRDPSKPAVPLADLKPEQFAQKTPSSKQAEPAVASAPQAPENPPSEAPSNTQEAAPFESMFNDLEQPSNANSLDFDLGFSTSQDLLNDSVFENIDMTNTEESANLNATSAEDINTLLPGLESYVNDGGDFSMIELPMTTMPEVTTGPVATSAGTEVATMGTSNAPGGGQGMDVVPTESNFDDLFGSGDWAGDGDMGDGAMVDFDEDWFKTDG